MSLAGTQLNLFAAAVLAPGASNVPWTPRLRQSGFAGYLDQQNRHHFFGVGNFTANRALSAKKVARKVAANR